ncbi:hypothetical protein GCM10009721_39190 [Terrabacter tumescens]|uniref:Helix-turn-helix domain-containing protein n=1 Tax=Terrabacter tumescens TaxID=60443 RepID=A0ABQ2ID91_9MICO|nr:hypothetical protein GCM10009721_39190 [Terrabacter tumescens]
MTTETNTWLTVNQTALRAGVSRATLYRYWERGSGPRFCRTPGGNRRVRVDWVDDWMLDLEEFAA